MQPNKKAYEKPKMTALSEKASDVDASAESDIVIPAFGLDGSVTAIKDRAFMGCSRLERVYILHSIQGIGAHAFAQCRSLQAIIYCGTLCEWRKIRKGADWDLDTGFYTVYCTDGESAKGE